MGPVGALQLLPSPFGLESIERRARLPRHRHRGAYFAVVLSGGYQESGDAGRFEVEAGDVLVHSAFEAHCNEISSRGATVLNLPFAAPAPDGARLRVADPERIARTAADDPVDAVAMLAAEARPTGEALGDWPDLLARRLRQLAPFHLADWASSNGIRPETVSRGFARAYAVTPHLYRAEARGRQAIAAIRSGAGSLAGIAAELGFSDQAHMTRIVRHLSGQTPGEWRR